MARPKAFVFDAYGTLFDVHSVVEAGRAVTPDPQALSTLWRQKQLEYTWLRALMGRYEDFWTVTEAALRWALGRLGIRAGETEIARLMAAYLSLATFPEVPDALAAMTGTPLGILSNGSPKMLAAAVRSSGLEGRLAHVLSVDAVRTYRPSPAVYELGTRAFGLPAGDILSSCRPTAGTWRAPRPSATASAGATAWERRRRTSASRPISRCSASTRS